MKYTKELVRDLCDEIEKGLNIDDACLIVGINQDTYHTWKKDPRKPEFSEAIKRANAEFKKLNLYVIQKASVKSWQAAAWLLERKFSEDYAPKWKGELTGKGGKPLVPDEDRRDDYKGFTTAQLQALLKVTDAAAKGAAPASQSNGNGNGNGNGHKGA